MLLYECEGFIEVEVQEIQQLCRSTFAVSFGSDDQNKYELQATLCDYQDESERRCRIAFYAKSLKRSLVFTVAGSEKSSLWQSGQKTLLDLGYQLEDVNLQFSPAMLEVILRDVPGVASPAEAQLHRSEQKRLFAELQATCDENSESPQGKRAALKLSTEKRLQELSAALRELLEDLFSPVEKADDETASLLTQIKDLTARLEDAEKAAESERSLKEISEAITTAAEKRIQELEEVLVDVETQSSDVLKQKRKVVALNRRVKELDAELGSVRETLAKEQEKQKQFIDDVKSANEQVVDLQRALKDSETLREEAFAQLGEQESEATQLDEDFREAELRIKELERELKTAEQNADGFNEAVKLSGKLQMELDKAEKELKVTTACKESLTGELADAFEERDRLQQNLKEVESLGQTEHAELLKESEGLKRKLVDALEERDRLQRSLKEAESLKQAESVDLARDKESLKEELFAALEERDKLQKSLQEAENLEQVKAAECVELIKQKQGLKEELSAALETHDGLQQSLREAEILGKASIAENAEQGELKARCAELANENERLREDFDQERSVRKRLEKGAVEDDRRISDLEHSLSQAEAVAKELQSGKAGAASETSSCLEQDMQELSLRFDQEQAAREALEGELEEAHKVMDSLEKMVRETAAGSREKAAKSSSKEQDDERIHELKKRLRALEDQLEGEILVKKALARELAAAEKKMAEQALSLAEVSTTNLPEKVIQTVVPVESKKASKPLPHELRPEPGKGAFFRPDWDLQGLPCGSKAQVFKAWESVFNVQMAIEGYPSQYCMAFMAVLKQGKQKSLYLLYRLKKDKYTLVCVPAERPEDEAALQKAIKEGLDFLRKSGFDMDEMSKDHIESTLGSYFLESD